MIDNIDPAAQARHQSSSHQNKSLHWTHSFAVKNRVKPDTSLVDCQPQMQVRDLQMIQILQSQEEHVPMQSCMVTLVFQVICKYFEVYRGFKLKIAWIKRIAESSNASWKIIPNQALSKHGGLEFLIECDYDPKLLNLENLPEFYHATTCDKQISIKKKKFGTTVTYVLMENRFILNPGV